MRVTVGIVHGGPEGPGSAVTQEILGIRRSLGDGLEGPSSINLVYVLSGSVRQAGFTGIRVGPSSTKWQAVQIQIAVPADLEAAGGMAAILRSLSTDAFRLARTRLALLGVDADIDPLVDALGDDHDQEANDRESVERKHVELRITGVDYDVCRRVEQDLRPDLGDGNDIDFVGIEFGDDECSIFLRSAIGDLNAVEQAIGSSLPASFAEALMLVDGEESREWAGDIA